METSNPSTAHSSLPQFRFINPGIHIFNYPAKNSAIYSCYGGRIGEEKIVTKKTNVFANINLDGSAVSETDTGISFLDHMLDKIASHALFDMRVEAIGDINFDDYRRTEGVGKAIGTALLKALGDNKVIKVCGDFSAVHDEALVHVSVDLSRGPHLSYGLSIPTEKVGTYDTQLVEHFFRSLVNTSGMTLHIKQLAGMNSHHIIVATFKAFARALRQATDYETRRGGSVPRFVFGSLIKMLNRIMAP
ncbi:UNVERIFIED_CONTAM: Imidazoleglycerol-phosphate dehydratase, chloroplastic [Sesamum radiatum]|uniref:Imidazoleglycerol-phosphate dehydratase, chloroplastic n=1 Tax=Sesamum radiatum TaxID=300843 RepID=A0AAW2SLX6_SESRA